MGVASASPNSLGTLVRRQRPPPPVPELAAGGAVLEHWRVSCSASPMVLEGLVDGEFDRIVIAQFAEEISDGEIMLAQHALARSLCGQIIEVLERPPGSHLQFATLRRVLKVVTKHLGTGDLTCRESNHRRFLMKECFDAWEEAAFPRLPKLHIPQLQFVIKLRLTEVTTGRASEEERQEQEEDESE